MPKHFLTRLAVLALALLCANGASAQVVISQLYGGGGNASATYTHDFVELFNRGSSPVSVEGWSVQYASATGTSWNASAPLPNVSLQPGQYYLVQLASQAAVGIALPGVDHVGGNVNMSGSNGKIALSNASAALSGSCPSGAAVVDLVGFGTANCFEGSAAAPTFGNNQSSLYRADQGCTDSNDNAADFSAAAVSPRNSTTTPNPCAGASLPVVSFVEASPSALEGGTGDANSMTFQITASPTPMAGSPVSFDVLVTGTAGRFTYSGPTMLSIDNTTMLPLSITVETVGNNVVQGNAGVVVTLSNFAGTDVSQPASVQQTGTVVEDDIANSEIFALQGSGLCSPLIVPCDITVNSTGPNVRTDNNVVTFVGPSGFFIQTPSARDDSDQLTSNGLYVFTFGAPVTDGGMPLAAGDLVNVVGELGERFGHTQVRVFSGRNAINSIVRNATAQPLPAAVEFGNPTDALAGPSGSGPAGTPSRDPAALSCGATNFECYENMRVTMAAGTVAASNQRFSTDLFAEVYVSAFGERAQREKGARFGNTLIPENTLAGIWDGNPEIIEMDADFLIPANDGLELFGGARFSAEGVIGFDFGDYEFWPATLTVEEGSNQLLRPVPVASPFELTIGSFNAFRLCDAVAGNTVSLCSNSAGSETDANRVEHQLGQVSAYIRQVLRSPDVVGMQEVENLAILQQLATQIANDGGPAYTAHLIEGNDVGGIDVGYLVNPLRFANVTVTQLNGNETWNDPENGPGSILHDRPPLLFSADFVGGSEPFPINIINNHTRSRGGVDVSDDDGQRVRAKRFVQAVSIANLVQELQSGATADVPLFVIGDHNAYQFTDAYADVVGLIAGTYINGENTCAPTNAVTNCKLPGGNNIVAPGLVNAVDLLDAEQHYSYNFTESFGAIQGSAGREIATNQVLDHALFNVIAAQYVTGMAYGRGNVDASDQRFRVCNYTLRDLGLCPQGPGSWVPTGSSDHDGFVLFVATPRAEDIFSNGFEPL